MMADGKKAEYPHAPTDIERLAMRLPEIDPRDYFDRQDREALEKAMTNWPFLVRLLGLSPGART